MLGDGIERIRRTDGRIGLHRALQRRVDSADVRLLVAQLIAHLREEVIVLTLDQQFILFDGRVGQCIAQRKRLRCVLRADCDRNDVRMWASIYGDREPKFVDTLVVDVRRRPCAIDDVRAQHEVG
jgi:hypothetical protein